jgi:spermidine synthase
MRTHAAINLERGFMPLFILSIILIEGFVTISLEILTMRQLVPFVGNSVAITSLIIGIFLLFLAYGYRQGGKYQDNYLERLCRNFSWAIPLLGLGLSYPFLDIFFYGARTYMSNNIFYSLGLYLILITAPTVYILGQTVPVTMNLIKSVSKNSEENLVGAIGGDVLHISTLGSFLGAVLTALVLMNMFGVAKTIFINYLLLFFMILSITIVGKLSMVRIIVLGLLGIVIFKCNIAYEKLAFIKTNSYGNYNVTEDRDIFQTLKGRMFKINAAHSSYLDLNNKSFPYVEMVKKIIFNDLKLSNKEILIVGAGGFSLTAEGTHNNHFTYVDIDPDMPKIAKGHFVDEIKGDFVAQEARAFFLTQSQEFDVIFSDVYNNMHEIPVHLITREYFQQIKGALAPGGYALFNIVSQATLESPYAKRIDNTIRSVYPSCTSIPMHYTSDLTNIIYICKNISKNDPIIYTDDLNKAQLDIINKTSTLP